MMVSGTRWRRTVSARLLQWYARHRRDLPWRRDADSYRVWVSEVMLQQTRIERAVPYYERFMKRFPDVASLARAAENDVLAVWSGLGYYRRCRQLHAAARVIVDEHDGVFPVNLDDALALPGVGRYTAGAVLSIAHNTPVPALDGNVERVLTRLLTLRGDPRRAAISRRLREEAMGLIPAGCAGDFNQALMEFGALVCTPAAPACTRCPLTRLCDARREGDPARYPERPAGRKTVDVTLGVIVVLRGPRVLVTRAPEAQSADSAIPPYLRGLWNFPLLELDGPSNAPAALEARLRRSWGGTVRVVGELGSVRHSITFRRLTIHAWEARVSLFPRRRARPEGVKVSGAVWRWARVCELGPRLAVPSMAWKVVRLLESRAVAKTW